MTAYIENGYIIYVATHGGNKEIFESEYNKILSAIDNRPTAQDGLTYKLKADTLTWELVELPEPSDTDEDATESDYIDALQDLGVEVDA